MSERFWASGHWQVREGKAEEFIQQWQEWLSQAKPRQRRTGTR